MSRIVNESMVVGDTITDTDLNSKFNDISVATSNNLDAENFRSESVDLPNVDKLTAGGRPQVILINYDEQWNGAEAGDIGTPVGDGKNYTSTAMNRAEDWNAPEVINHGPNGGILGPLLGWAIQDNDILRVHWQLWVREMDTVNTKLRLNNVNLNDAPCWVVWLEWDITSPALTDFVEVPDQGMWNDSSATDAGSATDETAATTIIPHIAQHWDSGGARTSEYVHYMAKDSWNWKNDLGDTVTVYGLRLRIHGLYHPSRRTGQNYIVHDNSAQNQGWDGDTILIDTTRMTALHMRSK